MDTRTIQVQPLSYINVPIGLLMGALACVSNDQDRYYTAGVYLHRYRDQLRIVSTDGTRLFVATDKSNDALPDFLEVGVIVPADGLKAWLQLARARSKPFGFVRLGYGAEQPRIEFQSASEDLTFTVQPIEGAFPDYRAVIRASARIKEDAEPTPISDFEAVGYSSQLLSSLHGVARAMTEEKQPAVCQLGHSAKGPNLFTFPDTPGAVLYLMPRPIGGFTPEAREIAEPAIAGSLAALRAHETRNRNWARSERNPEKRQEFLSRADGFAQRIAALVQLTEGAPPKVEGKKAGKVVRLQPRGVGDVHAPA